MEKFMVLLMACLAVSCNTSPTPKNDQKTSIIAEKEQKTEVSSNQLIVPANRLGTIKLKEGSQKVYDSLGAADAGDAAMQKALSIWYFENLKASLTLFTEIKDQNSLQHKIYFIRSTSPQFKTENGLGVSSSLEDVKTHFSLEKQGNFTENGQKYTLYETTKGIGFEFDKNQRCHGVIVHEPEARANQTYLPIYTDFDFTKTCQ